MTNQTNQTNFFVFTDKQLADALLEVKKGADVFSYPLATKLRRIERDYPQFVCITDVAGEYDGAAKLPYFGAVATSKGIAWARKVLEVTRDA